VERGEVGPLRELDLRRPRPAQQHEEVGIGDREILAHQVLASGELLVEPVEARREVLLRDRLVILRRVRLEERRKLLVDLGSQEVEPLLQPVAL
jgi:hypothetical protein